MIRKMMMLWRPKRTLIRMLTKRLMTRWMLMTRRMPMTRKMLMTRSKAMRAKMVKMMQRNRAHAYDCARAWYVLGHAGGGRCRCRRGPGYRVPRKLEIAPLPKKKLKTTKKTRRTNARKHTENANWHGAGGGASDYSTSQKY